MPDQRVTVIVPAWNAAEHIEDALKSIVANHELGSPVERVIVVDDGSSDDTVATVERFSSQAPMPFTIVEQENQGVASARNAGIVLTSTDLIAFLDSDDQWLRGSLAYLRGELEDAPNSAAVMGGFERLAYRPGEAVVAFDLSSHGQHTCLFGASLFRRSVFDELGLLLSTMRSGEDFEWFVRANEREIVRQVEPIVLRYRDRPMSITNGPTAISHRETIFHVLRERAAVARPRPRP